MNSRIKSILAPMLIGAAVFSCEQKDLENVNPNGTITAEGSSLAVTDNLIYQETFEGSSYFPLSGSSLNKTHAIENCGTDWTLSSVINPAYAGQKGVRFEIRKDQPLVGSSEKIRSEVTIIKGTEDSRFTKDIWYSFSVYFPSVGFEYDDTRDCINQWYEDGSDETTIRAEKDKVYLEVTPAEGSSTLKRYDLFSSNSGSGSSVLSNFTSIPKNQWNEFVFHFIHSKGSDGLIEVWRNGVKIHTITGRNMHLEYPKWKMGLYKSSFLDGSSKQYSRVIYFDNIRVGKTSATLSDMVTTTSGTPTTTEPTPTTTEPTPTTTEPAPTTNEPAPTTTEPTPTEPAPAPSTNTTSQPQVVSFTLIDASSDKEVMTIANGATINLNKLDLDKINIRANTSSTLTDGLVKFELSGAYSKVRLDDVAPYAMFGDNRRGDYYSWRPKTGNYTLKATVHKGDKGDGGAAIGPTYSINFTIAN